jgi:hypothetical protein
MYLARIGTPDMLTHLRRSAGLVVVVATLPLVQGCYSSFLRRASLHNYGVAGESLNSEYGFDRVAVMRVQVEDQTGTFGGGRPPP